MKLLKPILVLSFAVLGLWSSVFGSWTASKSDFKLISPSARELYERSCANCHGADGRGETEYAETTDVPNIADAKWQRRHSDKKIAAKIIKGGGGMPAFGKKLSRNEVNALVAYVRTLKK